MPVHFSVYRPQGQRYVFSLSESVVPGTESGTKQQYLKCLPSKQLNKFERDMTYKRTYENKWFHSQGQNRKFLGSVMKIKLMAQNKQETLVGMA